MGYIHTYTHIYIRIYIYLYTIYPLKCIVFCILNVDSFSPRSVMSPSRARLGIGLRYRGETRWVGGEGGGGWFVWFPYSVNSPLTPNQPPTITYLQLQITPNSTTHPSTLQVPYHPPSPHPPHTTQSQPSPSPHSPLTLTPLTPLTPPTPKVKLVATCSIIHRLRQSARRAK